MVLMTRSECVALRSALCAKGRLAKDVELMRWSRSVRSRGVRNSEVKATRWADRSGRKFLMERSQFLVGIW